MEMKLIVEELGQLYEGAGRFMQFSGGNKRGKEIALEFEERMVSRCVLFHGRIMLIA